MSIDQVGFPDMPWSAMSRHFARFIGRLPGEPSPELELAAALVAHAAEQGHVCLDLSHPEAVIDRPQDEYPSLIFPELGHWSEVLQKSSAVGRPGDFTPLVLDHSNNRLYLYRFWEDQQFIADELSRRATIDVSKVDLGRLRSGVARFFPSAGGNGPDWQSVAAVTAVLHPFCLISGGPGTGKTSTVVKILALLLEQESNIPLRMALAAPTGKAAARLMEAIRRALESLPLADEIRVQIPQQAHTLHRLLAFSGRTGAFRYHADNPLPQDVIVVDEASMIDLPMMAHLLKALPSHCRLIMLGDRDQLASVEAGAVLDDLCGPRRKNRFSKDFSQLIQHLTDASGETIDGGGTTPLDDNVVQLQRSYRFVADSPIGNLSRKANAGDGEGALAILQNQAQNVVRWREVPAANQIKKALAPVILTVFRRLLQASTPGEALDSLADFRILSALRRGPFGVENLNRIAHAVLAGQGLIPGRATFFQGRPIMITGNDYHSGLFNGDVGLIWPDVDGDQTLRAFFPQPDGGLRKLAPARLPPHETVFAMTVHKSQGSEFDEVLMVLPDRMTNVLSRELLYTGLTRARQSLEVWGREEVFCQALSRRIERFSGLKDLLWSSDPG